MIHEHFSNVMGQPPPRTVDINWDALGFQQADLSMLDQPFSEDEVLNAIQQMPNDKALGPDGITMNFFKSCWGTIKHGVMAAIQAIFDQRCVNLHFINAANIVLIPKKDGTDKVIDFCPISLIHGMAKIIKKILVLRLAPKIGHIVSASQSAFIRGRNIHDNFLYVQNLACRFHRNKTSALLFKLDILKDFDSVRWDYLLRLMQGWGFPQRWRNWIATLLASSTSLILLNGIEGDRIQHSRGLRQGDPLSPLLFILAIDPLQRLLNMATERGLLSKLRGRHAQLRTSMYADDAIVFLNPKKDVSNLASILQKFVLTSGLCTYFNKSSVIPIRCDNIDLDDILENFPAT